jgi:hypothetical protein
MKNDIESHSTNIGSSSKQFLLPSGTQLFLYALTGILLLLVLNIKNAWHYLNSTVLESQGGLDKILSQKAPGVHSFLSYLSQSIILQVIFWILVGCIVYVIFWFVRNITTNLLNDIVADKYVHPTAYKRFAYWESILARKVFFAISVVVLILFLATSARVLMYLASLAYDSFAHFQLANSLLELLQIVASTTGLIYILVLIGHIVINSWRFIYKDL